jgi:protein TonB
LASSSVVQDVAKASSVPAGVAAGPSEGTPPAGAPPSRGGSSPPPQDGVDAEDVKQYRFALGGNARRFKRYPALARERGWEGAVEIALVFRRLHLEPIVSLVGSSGKKILDDQALEMIRRAVLQTELPERLKGRDFRIIEEVVFSLDDE